MSLVVRGRPAEISPIPNEGRRRSFSATIDIAIPDAPKKPTELMARLICDKSRQKSRRSLLPRKGVSASVMFCRSEQAPIGGWGNALHRRRMAIRADARETRSKLEDLSGNLICSA
jgi:hypothetical protein